jgi:hypothetical protein
LRPPDALAHEYPISAIYRDTPPGPLGPWVVPGEYVVKLTVDGKTYSQVLNVKMDPRSKTTVIGLAQQYSLARSLWSAVNESFAAAKGAEGEIAKLNGDLAKMLEVVSGTDRAPTTGMVTAANELLRKWAGLKNAQR